MVYVWETLAEDWTVRTERMDSPSSACTPALLSCTQEKTHTMKSRRSVKLGRKKEKKLKAYTVGVNIKFP